MKKILAIILIIAAFKSQAQSVLQFKDDIVIQVSISEFQIENHSIDTCYYENQPYICKIDKNGWYGMDRGLDLPKYELVEIIVIYEGEKINLDVNQMFNPVFGMTISERQFEVKVIDNRVEIYAWFSDGAGTYCAKWLVKEGTSKRTLLSNSEADCFE